VLNVNKNVLRTNTAAAAEAAAVYAAAMAAAPAVQHRLQNPTDAHPCADKALVLKLTVVQLGLRVR
jgi:hypothetical protein